MHGQVEELTPPLRLRAYRRLRRFPQQKAQEHIAFFGDMPESTAVAARILGGDQANGGIYKRKAASARTRWSVVYPRLVRCSDVTPPLTRIRVEIR
jgi:hypothetical protein